MCGEHVLKELAPEGPSIAAAVRVLIPVCGEHVLKEVSVEMLRERIETHRF